MLDGECILAPLNIVDQRVLRQGDFFRIPRQKLDLKLVSFWLRNNWKHYGEVFLDHRYG